VLARQDVPVDGSDIDVAEWNVAYKAMLHQLVDGLDGAAFLADADAERPPFRPLDLGLPRALTATTVIQPTARRRVLLPAGPGDAVVTIGGQPVCLTAQEREALAVLLEHDSLTLAELEAALGEGDGLATVRSLASKALVFVFDAS
jgi:hypothetical protein